MSCARCSCHSLFRGLGMGKADRNDLEDLTRFPRGEKTCFSLNWSDFSPLIACARRMHSNRSRSSQRASKRYKLGWSTQPMTLMRPLIFSRSFSHFFWLIAAMTRRDKCWTLIALRFDGLRSGKRMLSAFLSASFSGEMCRKKKSL